MFWHCVVVSYDFDTAVYQLVLTLFSYELVLTLQFINWFWHCGCIIWFWYCSLLAGFDTVVINWFTYYNYQLVLALCGYQLVLTLPLSTVLALCVINWFWYTGYKLVQLCGFVVIMNWFWHCEVIILWLWTGFSSSSQTLFTSLKGHGVLNHFLPNRSILC